MIKWSLSIKVKNVQAKTCRVSATRQEIDDVTEAVLSTFSTATDAILDSAQHKLDALDAIWSDWTRYVSRQSSIAAVITDLETAGAANLEGRE